MKKTEMLKKNNEISNVMNQGKYFSGYFLDFFILKNNKQKNRICVAVTKKTGNSVVRNKIKRKIRENYRLLEENLNVGYSIVILWKKKKESEKATFDNIKNDMLYVFNKSKMLLEK